MYSVLITMCFFVIVVSILDCMNSRGEIFEVSPAENLKACLSDFTWLISHLKEKERKKWL